MPAAGPFMAAITGLGIVRRRVSIGMYSLRRTLPTSSGVRIPPPPSVTISVTSAPEQKARPDPVSTTTRTASSRSACLIASPSCLRVSAPMAFILSGRLSWINPTPSWTWTLTWVSTSVVMVLLPTFEDCLALLEKCAHPFLLVLCRKQEVEALALSSETLRERRVECVEHGLLGHPQRQRSFLGELACGALGDLDRHLCRHDLVGDAELLGPRRCDRGSGQHGLHGGVLARGSRPSLRATGAGNDPQVDLGLPESGGIAGDDHVGHQRELAPATQRIAVDGADEGLGESGDARPASGLVATQLLHRGALGHIADVCAGRKNLGPAGEDDGSHALVSVELAQSLIDLADELGAEGVQDLRPVERDGGDWGLDVNRYELVAHPDYDRPYGWFGGASGLLRASRGRPPDLDHRPVQLPLHLLHAGGRSQVAEARRPAPLRGDRPPRAPLCPELWRAHHPHHPRPG